MAGVEDYRAGRVRFDEFASNYHYEHGRHWAAVAPRYMKVFERGRLNASAMRLYANLKRPPQE
jgi:hypothetical protein